MATRPIVTSEQGLLLTLQLILKNFSDLQDTMPIQVAQTFLLVAIHEGCSLTDLLKRTGWAQSTLSRHLLDLGERNRHKEPGLNLVESRRDPMELRKNIYTLTPKGKQLVQNLLDLIEMSRANYPTGGSASGNISRQEARQSDWTVESGGPEGRSTGKGAL